MPFTALNKKSSFTPLAQAPKKSFTENFKEGGHAVIADILGTEQNKSTAFLPSLLRSTIGSQGLAGVAQLPGRVIDQVIHGKDQYNDITPGQALGTTLNAALTVTPFGEGLGKSGSIISKVPGLKFAAPLAEGTSDINKIYKAGRLLGGITENAGIGAGLQVGSNLANKKPIGEGVGTSALFGGAIPLVGTGLSTVKNKILGQAMPEAERVINSLIKPLGRDFAYGKNPAQGIIKEGIVANSFEDLSNQVGKKISDVGSQIGTLGQKLEQSGKISLDLTPALAPLDEAIHRAAKSNNQSLFNSLNNVKVALAHDLQVGLVEGKPSIIQGEGKNLLTAGYNQAKQFLTDIAEHTRFTGNPSDDKALNMATKQAYGIAREIMNTGADGVSKADGALIRDLNSRYADLLSAKNAINHRDIVMKRQNFLNLADRFAIPVSVAGALMTGFSTGDWSKAGLILASELGSVAVVKGLGSTASKTRIAQFLSKLAPEERIGILNSTPVLKNLYERVTGQTTPEAGAPKTKALQSIEDYIKNPKLGASISDVSKIHPDDLAELRDFTDYVAGNYKPKTTQIVTDARRIAVKYGLVTAEKAKELTDKALSSLITKAGIFK